MAEIEIEEAERVSPRRSFQSSPRHPIDPRPPFLSPVLAVSLSLSTLPLFGGPYCTRTHQWRGMMRCLRQSKAWLENQEQARLLHHAIECGDVAAVEALVADNSQYRHCVRRPGLDEQRFNGTARHGTAIYRPSRDGSLLAMLTFARRC